MEALMKQRDMTANIPPPGPFSIPPPLPMPALPMPALPPAETFMPPTRPPPQMPDPFFSIANAFKLANSAERFRNLGGLLKLGSDSYLNPGFMPDM